MEKRSGKNNQVTSDERDSLPVPPVPGHNTDYNIRVNNFKEVQENRDF
jgi:hypothetical protein